LKNDPQLVIIAVIAVVVTGIADVVLIVSGKEVAEVVGGTWVEYWAAFATVWNLVIIAVARYAGEKLLHREPDYYEREVRDE
jgi:hypothetical protein